MKDGLIEPPPQHASGSPQEDGPGPADGPADEDGPVHPARCVSRSVARTLPSASCADQRGGTARCKCLLFLLIRTGLLLSVKRRLEQKMLGEAGFLCSASC